jgi:DnaK suppressor protein
MREHYAQFREILLEMEKDILNQKDEPITSEKLPDAMDAAIEDNTKSFAVHFNARKIGYLQKIRTALRKIDNQTYGECEECSESIGIKRLLARPTALLCLDCKLEQENIEKKEKEKLKGGMLENWEDEV